MKTVALVGSLRKESYNLKLVEHLKNTYPELGIEVVEIGNLPFFNEDIEAEPGEAVETFRAEVKSADAVIIATPEYNGSISGVLKNAIDWLSRAGHELSGKHTFILGSSLGTLGSVKAQIHLRQILEMLNVNAFVLPSSASDVFVGAVHTKFDENGKLIDEPTVAFIDTVVGHFKKFIEVELNI